MEKKLRTYRCELCGSLVAVRRRGRDSLRCCGRPLQLLAAKATEASRGQEAPLLDLVEHLVNGQSCWHLPAGESAGGMSPF